MEDKHKGTVSKLLKLYSVEPGESVERQAANDLLDRFLTSFRSRGPLPKKEVKGITPTHDQLPWDEDVWVEAEPIIFDVPHKDAKYEVTGWPIADDGDGYFLVNDLLDSALFEIGKIKEATKQLIKLSDPAYASEIGEIGLLRYIEGLFHIGFDEDLLFPLMNAFFWILYYKGRQWTLVRSYAIEIVKWIPNDILTLYAEAEEFIETFSWLVKSVLCNRGVCALASTPTDREVEKGMYTIQATRAFYALVKPFGE